MMRSSLFLLSSLLLAACTTVPTGPSMLVLPGTGKSFDQFRVDDMTCRQYAQAQIGGTNPNQAAVSSGVISAAVGTALGAAAGAAINGGHGAGVGAGTGLLAGGLMGSGTAQASSDVLQQRYDNSYVQCMYASGNRVPVYSSFTTTQPSLSSYPPPPPPGTSVH